MSDYSESNQDLSYYFWKKKKKNTFSLLNEIESYNDPILLTLKTNYSRQIVIFDEIIEEASMQLNDSQYCETTSWNYENELDSLYKEAETLSPLVEKIIEKIDYQNLLISLDMTHEQYQEHCLETSKLQSSRRKKNRF